jgi:uncharacterized protein (TIGR03437 family)
MSLHVTGLRWWCRYAPIAVAICASATLHASGPAQSLSILAGANPAGIATDAQGNVYVTGQTSSAALPVTSGALQPTLGGSTDAFIAKIAPDGTPIWCTYFGGKAYDVANGLAVDSAGDVVVIGTTQSADLPLRNAYQATLQGNSNAFIAKLDPAGRLLYSTYLGGQSVQGIAVAVDGAGGAYLTGRTNSHDFPGLPLGTLGVTFVAKLDAAGSLAYSYLYSRNVSGPRAIAVDSSGSAYVVGEPQGNGSELVSLRQAFVIKLSPDGSHLLYESFFGGSKTNVEVGIVVDSTGAAYIAGTTDSVDFPLVHPLQSSLGARPLWKSTDGGATWTPIDNLPFAYLQTLVPDAKAANTLYAGAADRGVFKTTDGGSTWTRISTGIADPQIYSLAVDPFNSSSMYASGGYGALNTANAGWIYKTTDLGNSWKLVDSELYNVTQLAIDPLNPLAVYALTSVPSSRTTDGGATWTAMSHPGAGFNSIVTDPQVQGRAFAATPFGTIGPFPGGSSGPNLFRTTDSGATWQQLPITPSKEGIFIDPTTSPETLFSGSNAKSQDAGDTWTLAPPKGQQAATVMVVDPRNGTQYAAASTGLNVSTNRGQSFTSTGWPFPPSLITAITPAPDALYVTVRNTQLSAFVVKLSPDGSKILYSTLLGGHPAMADFSPNTCGPTQPVQCDDPAIFVSQNWAAGIALDRAGNIVVVGGTHSADFPTANALQAANAGGSDAFVAVISPDGSQLRYSTYLGGSHNDGASGVAIDAQGNVLVAGLSSSPDFLANAPKPAGSYGFVVKVPTGPPAISAVVDSASFGPAIESGSWVTIQGSNLANTTRSWKDSDFNGSNLPTSLDGVSVTINGKPAFVAYISPSQINVQAPSDNSTGAVAVVVNNNSVLSAPVMAQLQAAAPAFFLYPGTTYAIASRLPGYVPVGTPSAPAKPGDTVVLWGTGFGATNPAVSAGVVVSGTPMATTPTVTVGGVAVPVMNALLTAGSVGLYQITIQLPANVPTGAVEVQASVSGAQRSSGGNVFVGKL